MIGLDPAKIDYLRHAARFLGVIDTARIDNPRGELPARYATRFDVVPPLEYSRLSR